MSDIVQKLWGFCHTLRHDGIDYGDYIEQITYLLFLKMADERGIALPKGCDWPTLRDYTGTELTDHYIDILRNLGKAPGLLGDIYAGAQSRFKNPVNLKRLIALIDETEWTSLGVDVKAVVLKVNSPGGEVLASDDIYSIIKKFQKNSHKPVVASMGSLAASGGYYVSAPCQWIVANELTITGSIGVIMHGYNYRGLMKKIGLRRDFIWHGEFHDSERSVLSA